MDSRRQGSRVIQIPLEWPARDGTVLDVDRDESRAAVLIAWDDGRQEWIDIEEIRPLRIWFVSDEPIHQLMPGPLEAQLAGFMEAEPAAPRPSRFSKGPS